MAVCTSVSLIEHVNEETDILEVTIDNEVKAYMVYSYADCLKFLNQEVIVSYRKDVYNGKICNFVNTLAIVNRVTTLDREEDIKLFCNVDDNNSNVCFSDIKVGETMIGAIMYCVSCAYESSNKATWMTIKVRDRAGRIANVRLFDYTTEGLIYNGIYVKADIKRTKYGFNTDMITPMEFDFPLNPEIEIAKSYVWKYFIKDEYMYHMLQKTSLLDHMESYISLEKGYELVRLAVELDTLDGLKNSLDDIDFKAVAYALVCSYGYITKSGLTRYSPSLRTITFALQQNMPADVATKVLMLLDDGDVEEPLKEREIYRKIVSLADTVIKIKKEAL